MAEVQVPNATPAPAEQTETPQSNILNEEEVNALLQDEGTTPPVDEVELPSEVSSFEMPEKFKGKTAEEIAQSYIELEKLKAKKEGEGEQVPPNDETPPQETPPNTEESVDSYFKEYAENGALSEESYQALADKGYSKEQVDEQIDFYNYKQEKATAELL